MTSSGLALSYSVLSNVAGVAGNLFALTLFVSPIATFRRIARNRSTEQFSGLPYIYSLLNCLISCWYGLPFVTPGVILVATVNSVGALFQFLYITIFIIYAENAKRVKMSGLLLAVFGVFGVIVFVSIRCLDPIARQIFVGCLSVAALIFMFASPLFIIVIAFQTSTIHCMIRTRSVEFMPFYLSLSTFLMSLSFFAYGMLKHDIFIYAPNGIGTILGTLQLLLYAYYSRVSREDSRRPLIGPHV
ncbi:bidirectional sugar transporter SWEET2a-like isoform X1 [Tasmannia lanceolata]|uniref:bidirectional sugar transporter SWEET2a-like isoform X1 n=1 Tax=Tasmannia lanceolata TaxID=3420 RepID=UPI004062A916